MAVADSVVASDEDVESVRRWVRLSCTEPGTHLPALATIATQLQLTTAVVRSALERLATEGLVTLHEGYRHYSVGTMSPTERAYRLIRTVIHRSFLPGERFMTRFEIGQSFDIGTKEAAAAVRRLVAEGLLVGPRGQYVNEYGPEQQRRRVKQLRERASDLRREALELMRAAREVEQQMEAEDVFKVA
ncbi:GntR family transcriptional regulator [Streptomyces liliifuscus]|uniref:GntR family transcriptional regulator n=1 Tax=Streptomyces liliifuscus TaxID=2797636 RepID=A0A7T7HZ42_9ACTN|nr:GntR family transcriptional regulator [Streptomyces liliifuscus]QQM38051.1 GntR family transcriptional regulator [Streptomyces liliifuscus]QQM46391.1 GntR family transcriptional regulator [Streptomyces liliifuscus]